ncbi:SDR family NAD(P)-dependent oxidoreductase [Novosphingobium lentum]|uniref:SDR family NAD(P)-dependent oxidoreductase n=1 Tax=Novosphingobium lentum TaxID=145287 RepID=UPI00082A5BF0|nr:SDR family NAD(P)-dependent oxidoreductase [Novosphingobium lentum]
MVPLESIDLGLAGKAAVVTGSARGWGRGIALELAARGVRVIVNGRSAATTDATVQAIRDAGGTAESCIADVGTTPGCDALVEACIAAFGTIDILINNAGFLMSAPLWDMTDAQWDEVLATQLTAQFRCSRAAARHMIAAGHGGRIINMVGGGGFTGQFNNANHAASKGGGMGAVLTWAGELAPHAITVNGVVGIVETDLTRPLHDKVRAARKAQGMADWDISARDLGSFPADEAASIVVWLASAAAAEVTGQFFEIQGPEIQLWRMATIERSFHRYPRWTPEAIEQAGIARIAAGPPRIEPSVAARLARMKIMHK